MYRFGTLFFALALGTSSAIPAKPKPVQMTEAQLDMVAGGQGSLIEVTAIDLVDVNNNQVQVLIPVNATVAAGVLGNAAAAGVQQPGRNLAIR